MKKIITALLFTLLVVQAVFTTAFAADTGSLTVKLLRADETPVSGRQIKAYRAGNCTIDYDGEPYFTTADSFKGAGVTLTSENAAQKLSAYAKNNSLTFQTYTSDANDRAV
ncbi:MAG: hypothetical protein IK085_04530, partial [Clostridia bacterium]|nr:hypothetical protein [Clostridia bacterium]